MRTLRKIIQFGDTTETIEYSSDADYNIFLREAVSVFALQEAINRKKPIRLEDYMLKFGGEEAFGEPALSKVIETLQKSEQIQKSINSSFNQQDVPKPEICQMNPPAAEINKEAFFRP